LGSVRQLVTDAGKVMNSYAYTAWGVPLNWRQRVPNRYTFTSREWDPDSALYHYRLRHYASTLGRFTSRDPMQAAPSYAYAFSSPTVNTDPNGYGVWTCSDECIRIGDTGNITKIEARLIGADLTLKAIETAKFTSETVDFASLVGVGLKLQRDIVLPKVVDLYVHALNDSDWEILRLAYIHTCLLHGLSVPYLLLGIRGKSPYCIGRRNRRGFEILLGLGRKMHGLAALRGRRVGAHI